MQSQNSSQRIITSCDTEGLQACCLADSTVTLFNILYHMRNSLTILYATFEAEPARLMSMKQLVLPAQRLNHPRCSR